MRQLLSLSRRLPVPADRRHLSVQTQVCERMAVGRPDWRHSRLVLQSSRSVSTSCRCSTDSGRPHRCCHLPNNIGARRIILVFHNGRDPNMHAPQKNCAFCRDPGPHLIQYHIMKLFVTRAWLAGGPNLRRVFGSLSPLESALQRRLDRFIRSSTAHGRYQHTQTLTDAQRC